MFDHIELSKLRESSLIEQAKTNRGTKNEQKIITKIKINSKAVIITRIITQILIKAEKVSNIKHYYNLQLQ